MTIEEKLTSHAYAEVADAYKGMGDPQARAYRAEALCFLQAEEEAASLIADLPFIGVAARAHAILATYFASRQRVVKGLKINDVAGAKWAKTYAAHDSFQGKCRLSAVLIVKNEAKHIGRCLKSIAPLVDEIVLLDTGSTDDTVAIAKKSAGKVPLVTGDFEWCDDFSAARNAALKRSTGDWALWIDADETLQEDGFGEIRQAIIRPHFGGFHLRIVNFTTNGDDAATYTHAPLRLFRRLPGVSFSGRIHEQVASSVVALGMPLGNLESATLHHEGYRPAEMEEKGKYERFVTMLEREVRDHPDDAFQWFNLANAYTITRRFSEAEHAARRAVLLAKPGAICVDLSYQLLGGALTALDRPEEAVGLLEESLRLGVGGMFAEFELANAWLKLQKPDQALAAIDRVFTYEWGNHTTGDYTLFSFKRHVVRGQALALLGRYQESIEMFDHALAVSPDFSNASYLRAATLVNLNRLDEALADFRTAAKDESLQAICLSGMGRIYNSQGKFKEAAEAFERAWAAAPDDYDAWAAWANACEAANDLETVIRAYTAFAAKKDPTAEILINWGRALDRAGQTVRALECFSEAVQLEPANPNGYFNAGDLLFRIEAYQDAAHLYEAGLRVTPEYAPGWFVLGNSLAHMGLIEGAKIAYGQVLILQPDHAEAAHNLAAVLEVAAA